MWLGVNRNKIQESVEHERSHEAIEGKFGICLVGTGRLVQTMNRIRD